MHFYQIILLTRFKQFKNIYPQVVYIAFLYLSNLFRIINIVIIHKMELKKNSIFGEKKRILRFSRLNLNFLPSKTMKILAYSNRFNNNFTPR